LQIHTYNGSAIVAMAGKDCVAIGSDLRLGVQFQTLATDYQKVFQINDKLFVGLAGLGTDAQTLSQLFKFRCGAPPLDPPGPRRPAPPVPRPHASDPRPTAPEDPPRAGTTCTS